MIYVDRNLIDMLFMISVVKREEKPPEHLAEEEDDDDGDLSKYNLDEEEV